MTRTTTRMILLTELKIRSLAEWRTMGVYHSTGRTITRRAGISGGGPLPAPSAILHGRLVTVGGVRPSLSLQPGGPRDARGSRDEDEGGPPLWPDAPSRTWRVVARVVVWLVWCTLALASFPQKSAAQAPPGGQAPAGSQTPAGGQVPAGTISGVAKDALGRPLAGAQLRLETADGQVAGKTTTDEQGHFTFTEVASGTYAIVAEKGGFETATGIVTVEEAAGGSLDLTLSSKKALEMGAVQAERLPEASSSTQMIPGKDFELRPQGRPADILRLVPGLIIAQHQGGGKAEEYFIRGFDADHGTDVAVFVDGLPVNLRSHAHGQGYADLHFPIPETVKAVD